MHIDPEAKCEQCGGTVLEFDDLDNFCDHCITEMLLDSIEGTTADSTVPLDTRRCPQCQQWNDINWWWHSQRMDRWVCYPCGMGRRKEQTRIDRPRKK